MKLIALAAALALGGTAIAQETTTTTTTTGAPAAGAAEATPQGGYQPSTPLFAGGTPPAGAQVQFVPNPQTPSQAYPAPAPLDHYPICKRGQTDQCMQRGAARRR